MRLLTHFRWNLHCLPSDFLLITVNDIQGISEEHVEDMCNESSQLIGHIYPECYSCLISAKQIQYVTVTLFYKNSEMFGNKKSTAGRF